MQLTYRTLQENMPSEVWLAVFKHGWTGWKRWFEMKSTEQQPDLITCQKALRRHMPEYVHIWEKQVELLAGDELAARFLSFWSPPRYLVNCSQAVLSESETGPILVRNYDLDPRLNESTLLCTNWTGGRKVMGMVEGMSGLSDGINDAGLAASLTFGGRVNVGSGFGIPLIMRYLLEMCVDVQDALEVLRAIPSHMSYNVTLLDKQGHYATVYLAPDRPPMVTKQACTTNHQLGVEWPAHAELSETVKRSETLQQRLPQIHNEAGLKQCFMQEPVFRTGYERGFGTVYTAAYRPHYQDVQLLWPGQPMIHQNLQQFYPTQQTVSYGVYAPDTPVLPAAPPPELIPVTASPLGSNPYQGEVVDWTDPESVEKLWRGFAVSWYRRYVNNEFQQH